MQHFNKPVFSSNLKSDLLNRKQTNQRPGSMAYCVTASIILNLRSVIIVDNETLAGFSV